MVKHFQIYKNLRTNLAYGIFVVQKEIEIEIESEKERDNKDDFLVEI